MPSQKSADFAHCINEHLKYIGGVTKKRADRYEPAFTDLCKQKRITAYVKYNQFDRMQNETIHNKNPFTVDKLTYDEQNNQYLYPIGEPMKHIGWTIQKTKGGYPQVIDSYKAQNCQGCFLNGTFHTQKK